MTAREGSLKPEERPSPGMGEPGYLPDHTEERRAAYRNTTPGERVAEAIEVSRTATKLAALAARPRER
jgi:hypothetical protein